MKEDEINDNLNPPQADIKDIGYSALRAGRVDKTL
jgi:hypothetical protein